MIEIIEDFKCTAPWEGLFINPDGDFRVCCSGKSLGNLNNNTVEEIVNGPVLKQVQADILAKGHSKYCLGCMDMHHVQGRSLRDGYGKDLSTIDTTKFKPGVLDVRWRNTCQLRCIYCNSEWSSAFAQWEKKTWKVSERQWQQEVLDYIKDNHQEVFKHTYMLGGEPLLLKENAELLDILGNNDLVGVVTNLSVFDVESLPVYQKLISKDRVSWLVSFENVGNKFEYVRRNGKWETTKANFEKLYNLKKGVGVGCHMTYNFFSAFSLVETFDWLFSVVTKETNSSLLTICLGPNHFVVKNYPKEIKELAIKELNDLQNKYADMLSDVQIQSIENIRQDLINTLDTYSEEAIEDLKTCIKQMDEGIEPISFANEWPKLQAILERY